MTRFLTKSAICLFWFSVAVLSPLVAILAAFSFALTLGRYYAWREAIKADESAEAEELQKKIAGHPLWN